MFDEFLRTKMLLGEEKFNTLSCAKVAVFGVGGVGGFTVEALARSGIKNFTIVDNDVVDFSNINRQIIATHETVGKLKIEVMKDRIISINPSANVKIYPMFYNKENADNFDLSDFSYIVDAIDTVTSKLLLIEKANLLNVPIISSMGTGNKLDPTKFEVSDIFKTSVCPLAKVIRHELRKRNIKKLKVVYSKEDPIKPFNLNSEIDNFSKNNKRQPPASIAFMPSVAGLILASEVIKDLIT